jgi:hypothetical protein
MDVLACRHKHDGTGRAPAPLKQIIAAFQPRTRQGRFSTKRRPRDYYLAAQQKMH